jgi:hypothetical protein
MYPAPSPAPQDDERAFRLVQIVFWVLLALMFGTFCMAPRLL